MEKQSSSNSPKISPKRLRTLKMISIGFGLLMAVFFGELTARVYYFGIDAFSYTKVNSFIPLGSSGFLKAADDYRVLYQLKPNIDTHFKLKKFKTNSHGHRDKEYSKAKPDNTIRGLVIGDSFTMGSGVDIEEVYHSVIEQSLNEQSDGINYEVINFGVGGYNLLNYLGVLEEQVASYDPDFIIIGFCALNDYFLPSEKHYEGNYKIKIKDKGKKPFFSCYLAGLIERTFASTTTKRMFDMEPQQITFMDEMFGKISAFSMANDIPVIINVLSLISDNGNMATVQEIAARYKIPMTDSFDRIDPKELSSNIISKLDHHPNAKANKVYARALLEFDKFQEMIEEQRRDLVKVNQ